jgi:polysaccharide export outer membrane protein
MMCNAALCRFRQASVRSGWDATRITLLGVTLLVLSGCATNHGDLVAFLRSHEAEVATGHYAVRPPDSIMILAPEAPEVHGTKARLRPDGKIVLRLLGEVDVAGLTTEEVADKIRAQLSRYYVDPEVVVNVSEYRSQFYYVFGQVEAAGPRPYTGRDTLLRALAEAKPNFLAWRAQVRVTRPSAEEGERKIITVDLDKMTRSGDLTMNILLQEGDIIEVPPTPLAWIGLRVRELLYPVQPAISAYTTPAAVMNAQDVYDDDPDDDNNRPRIFRN